MSACGKRDKSCRKACNSAYRDALRTCRDANFFHIREVYPGYKTLSMYDILKLIGYE